MDTLMGPLVGDGREVARDGARLERVVELGRAAARSRARRRDGDETIVSQRGGE